MEIVRLALRDPASRTIFARLVMRRETDLADLTAPDMIDHMAFEGADVSSAQTARRKGPAACRDARSAI